MSSLYADDAVVHCDTEGQAQALRAALAERLGTLDLELHPEKTKIVYCQDAKRRGSYKHTTFDSWATPFGPVAPVAAGAAFRASCRPSAARPKKAVGDQIRDWHLRCQSGADLSGLAEEVNPQIHGWINYYGAYYGSGLRFLGERIDEHILRWAMHKFKRLRNRAARARAWLEGVRQREPRLFAHWYRIAHRLFSFISLNWAGVPLQSYELILKYIRTTTTKTGLTVDAWTYPRSVDGVVVGPPARLESKAVSAQAGRGGAANERF